MTIELSDEALREIMTWAMTRRDFCAMIQHDYTRYNNVILAIGELQSRRAAPGVREEALEEAAKVADAYERSVTAFSYGVQKAAEKAANTIAERIRALKTGGHGNG